jgi:predicted O-methyltransferase YrrM
MSERDQTLIGGEFGPARTTTLRRVIDRLMSDGSVVSRLDSSSHELHPIAIGPAEGAALSRWVQDERASNTIEIGLGYGISTLFICDGLLAQGGGHHLALDPNQTTRFSNCGLQVLEEAGVMDLVEHVSERSEIALPRLLEEGKRFDLAFVDGNHRFDGVFLDLVHLGRLLDPGKVIVVDDYQLPSVKKATSFFVANLDWTIEAVCTDEPLHHWAAIRTAVTADERPYDHFVAF